MGLLKAEFERAGPQSHQGGPHNLGDPADRSLKHTESEILIINIVRERAKELKCVEEWKQFNECVNEAGMLKMRVTCRPHSDTVKQCMTKWFHDVDFQRECMNIYLDRRSRYRATGVPPEEVIYKRKR